MLWKLYLEGDVFPSSSVEAGAFPANRATEGMSSGTSVSLNFASKEVVILGSQRLAVELEGFFGRRVWGPKGRKLNEVRG